MSVKMISDLSVAIAMLEVENLAWCVLIKQFLIHVVMIT